jgi:hypothetical protein
MKKPPPRPKREKKPPARGVMIVNIPMPDNMTAHEMEVQVLHVIQLLAQSLPLSGQADLYRAMAMRCNELGLLARVAAKGEDE